jgi:ERCC4-type nuclease
MQIITDTREQLPYWSNKKAILIVGDYTTTKLYNIFHIERKTLMDLYQTLTFGNDRFKYELFRAAYHSIKLEMYIEGTYDDFINKRWPNGEERKFTKTGLERLVSTFQKKYYLPFHWAKSRPDCKILVESRLNFEEKK